MTTYEQVSKVLVCALPFTDEEAGYWTVEVVHCGNDRWAVKRSGMCLKSDGKKWAYESNPSSRTKTFLRCYRMDYDTAIALAHKVAPTITVNGMTADSVLKWRKMGHPRPVPSELITPRKKAM